MQIFKNPIKHSKQDLFDRKTAKGFRIFLETHTHIPHAIFELHPPRTIPRLTNNTRGGEQ